MPLNNAFYRMQVNLHGSLCKLLLYLYTVMVIEKTKFSTESKKTHHFDLKI